MSAYRLVKTYFGSRVLSISALTILCSAFIAAAFLVLPSATADEHSANPLVLQLNLDREVEPVLATYIDEGIADAASRHAPASCTVSPSSRVIAPPPRDGGGCGRRRA